ncbi:carotenoid ester lipase precursor [Vararia minispora EC-137]|uniref:Carotenoid ester lipase n=1 Tax=Vararia minispora EC-137 TaxID=1314806 RepID=A0ACB8Q885_9AGAM|nr:carotenoid ester lipase precursor [Vararia minispora EC-137]
MTLAQNTLFLVLCTAVYAVNPTVILDNGTFIGSALGTIDSFLGIPFALPPVGELRFRAPQPNDPYRGLYNAGAFGPACIQQPLNLPDIVNPTALSSLTEILSALPTPAAEDEDCLTLDIVKPAGVTSESKLPVVYWIFGGGFEIGYSAIYNGSAIVERSLELGMPVVYVAVNYRLSALGFPAGKETREAGNGNLGFQDQREGLRWVQKYIAAFGGDPTKVMIWGESAGAISVAAQMLMNNGDTEGLFRAAFAESGSPIPTNTVESNQAIMDKFVTTAGCGDELGSSAVFDCLRSVSIEAIRTGINATPGLGFVEYTSIYRGWNPTSDGVTIPEPFLQMVLNSNIANIPLVSGDCDDEGTAFSLSNSNITTSSEFEDYITELCAGGNRIAVEPLFSAYPEDPTVGSPYDTGTKNNLTSQFKRLASISGDFFFEAPRRLFLQRIADKQPVYSYITKRMKSQPVLGAFHTSDLFNVFGPGDMTDYLIRFATTLDPNSGNTNVTEIQWPRYTLEGKKILTFLDGKVPLRIEEDTFRDEEIKTMTKFLLANPLP